MSVHPGEGSHVSGMVTDASGATATACIGGYHEQSGEVSRSYYYLGGKRVAMRDGDGDEHLYFLLADHLGSTAITADTNGSRTGELRYTAWGETRYEWGATPTKRRYTGQVQDSYTNLYWMGSRLHDPSLGRWISPDTIVPEPGNPQSLDRYSYVYDNPVRYRDASGRAPEPGDAGGPEAC